jgi:Abnormal spindle-like microcephaly-assoc'd, ASPM-SPD-2-Hydin
MMRLARNALLATGIAALLAAATPAQAQFNAFKDPAVGGGAGSTSGPDLSAAEATVEGGKITVGATAYVVALFTNKGSSPVKVTGINLYPSSTVSAQVTLNKCAEAPLPPEAKCAITVAVTGLQAGSWRVEVLLDHDGRTRLATAALTGDVDGSLKNENDQVKDDIEAVPDLLDFGTVNGGIPMVRSILLRNRTGDNVALSSYRLDSAPQSGITYKSECPESLAPSGSCVVTVTWAPVTRGAVVGVLTVGHSAKTALTKIDVKGTFEPSVSNRATIYPDSAPDQGILISDKEAIEFGSGINSASSITVSLVNIGTRDLTLKSIRLAGSESGLNVSRAGCRAGLVLKPVDACALTIGWVPSRVGSVIDDLQILHTGARGVLVLPIRGTADAAASRESAMVRTTPPDVPDILGAIAGEGGMKAEPIPVTAPSMDGYSITSLSARKAVINGPVGSLVVRDGEDVVIAGVKWTVTVGTTGVTLANRNDEVLLVFDRSLRVGSVSVPVTPASNNASSNSNSNSTATQVVQPAAQPANP